MTGNTRTAVQNAQITEYGSSKAEKHARLQRRMLLRGRTPSVSPVEKILLERQGRTDGAADLVRPDADGSWNSPFIRREESRLSEYCSKVWGLLQIDNAELLTRLGTLIDEIDDCIERLEELTRETKDLTESYKDEPVSRKRGEENLSEGQVRARRSREQSKRFAPLRKKKTAIESRLRELFEEACILRNRMTENCNASRLVCERTMQHSGQRLNVYWRAAMMTSPSSKDMPAAPASLHMPEAESIYFRSHRKIFDEADAKLAYIAENYAIEEENDSAEKSA